MRNAKSAIAIMLIASLFVPTVYAKAKKAPATPPASATSQAGGLPATNARVAALEGTVATLQADVAALSAQLAMTPTVFVAEGSQDNIKDGTGTVVSTIVPAGDYFMLAAVQMTNGQASGDANARCVMRANGTLLADTSDLQFPILTAAAGPPSGAYGSTMFAPLQGTYSSSTPITLTVRCNESNGKNGGLNAFVQVAAMKMGSVHVQ